MTRKAKREGHKIDERYLDKGAIIRELLDIGIAARREQR